jgi:hypothetical protein
MSFSAYPFHELGLRSCGHDRRHETGTSDIFYGNDAMRGTHLQKGKVEAQAGFGALILVHTVGMQPVAATAGLGIVKRPVQLIFAKNQLKTGRAHSLLQ